MYSHLKTMRSCDGFYHLGRSFLELPKWPVSNAVMSWGMTMLLVMLGLLKVSPAASGFYGKVGRDISL